MNNITVEKYIVLVCGLRISAIFASEYDIIKVKYFFGSQVLIVNGEERFFEPMLMMRIS